MKLICISVFLITLLTSSLWGAAPADLSFLSVTRPANCGTNDNATVTGQQLFSGGTGFACVKTLIFPQFVVGNGWTSQFTFMMPTQPPAAGLVNGTNPGFGLLFMPGSGATATPNNGASVLLGTAMNGCLGLWAPQDMAALQTTGDLIDSGGADNGALNGLATLGSCTGGSDVQIPGGAQGPLQIQIAAPNAMALSQATVQLTYSYDGGSFSWQVTVNPVDINNAKPRWTAPLYQGNGYVTAFSVVNASGAPQTVSISRRDNTGAPIGNPVSTPVLAAGCGCDQLNQSAAGGFYASTVQDFFGDNSTHTGSIEFDGTGNIIVIVLRTISSSGGSTSLGSVPAR